MMRVRFPNGTVLTYPAAEFLDKYSGCFVLRPEANGEMIVAIPHASGAIVEWDAFPEPTIERQGEEQAPAFPQLDIENNDEEALL